MKENQKSSLQFVHSLYRRHVSRHLVELVCLLAGGMVLSAYLLILLAGSFSISDFGINLFFVLLGGVLLYIVAARLWQWGKEGFRISAFFHHWEQKHPEIANRPSLLVYAEKKPEEVKRLGYSRELIDSDDRWLNEYITRHTEGKQELVSSAMLIFLACVFVPVFVFWVANPDFSQNALQRILHVLYIQEGTTVSPDIRVKENIHVARGDAVTLTASMTGRMESDDAFIHISTGDTWRTLPAKKTQTTLAFPLPAVRRHLAYYFSVGEALSNQGKVTPLDSPTLAQGTIDIAPPEYTHLASEQIKPMRPITVPEGSQITIQGEASTPLTDAAFSISDQKMPVHFEGKEVSTSFTASQSGELSFDFQDEFGLSGQSRSYLMTVVPDASPEIEVLHPKVNDRIPELLVQRVQVRAKDDYELQHILAYSKVNHQESTKRVERIWSNVNESSEKIAHATQLFVTYDWDLSQFGLFPGDEFTFFLEVWDNDALHGPKRGQSQTHTLRYPTLAELLSNLEENERSQTDDLGELVEEQHKIMEDAGETIDKISKKIETQTPDKEQSDQMWMEKKELEDIKNRQESLVEEAKKIQEELNKYQEQATQNLSEEERKQQGFTPETLEKMDRIKELMEELVDRDTQQLLQKIDKTIEEMSKQVTTEQLEDLKFSFQDFDQELDRTLSMLEKTYQERQLEGLRNMAEELAQRQDHLRRETENLAKKKSELENQKSANEQNADSDTAQDQPNGKSENGELQAQEEQLNAEKDILTERQKQLQQDAQNMMNKMKEMQEALQEENPQLSEALKQLQEQMKEQRLQEELSQASEQIQQDNMEQAQSHQKNAEEQLQQLAQQFQQQMFNMGGMKMQMDTSGIKRLVDRGLFLSGHIERLAESVEARQNGQRSLRMAQACIREIGRIQTKWLEMAQTNPFMGRIVKSLLDRSGERLQTAVDSGQGEKWVGIHETRQSVMTLNRALYEMMQDMQNMQQQMAQSNSQGFQQQMQQMISQQQNFNEMLNQLRQMGKEGQQMIEQLREMANQQAQIRKEIEKMMQQYRHVEQMKNRLQGIYEEMRELEELLKAGENDERVENKEKRIMTRMLEAGTMQEQDEYGKRREEEVAKTGTDADSPTGTVPMDMKEKARQAVERPPEERIPLQYREALKNYYTRLSEQLAR